MYRIRLDRYITNALKISRSEARKIIKSKKIAVNLVAKTKNDYLVSENDKVYYNDNILVYKEYTYIMMNKPKDYISSTEDKRNKTVIDLINNYKKDELFIVGRLDIDTEGLLLITNDGALCHELTAPKSNCNKVYYVEVDCDFTLDDVTTFQNGTSIYETTDLIYKCKKATLEIDEFDKKKAHITITEGKYHQIKKMCKSVGKEVLYLKRIKIGNLCLDSKLLPGEYRELLDSEVEMLKNK